MSSRYSDDGKDFAEMQLLQGKLGKEKANDR